MPFHWPLGPSLQRKALSVSLIALLAGCSGAAAPTAKPSAAATPAPATATAAPATAAPTPAASSAATPSGALNFPPNVVLGHSFCYLNNEGMQIYNNSTIAAATALGWKILPSTDSGNSPSQQVTDITTLLAQGVNVLAIQPCDSSAIAPGVAKAVEANAAVIMTDIGSVAGKAVTVVADEVQSGDLACQGLLGGLKKAQTGDPSGKVVQIQGEITSDAAQGRTKGFEDCLAKNAPGVKVITVPTKFWDPTQGTNGLQTTVAANPDVVGVYLQSDTQFWTGTKQVLQTAGLLKKVGEAGHVVVVGVDGGTAILQGIRDGYADADVSQPKTTYFMTGLPFISLALQGKLDTVDPAAFAPLVIEKNAQGGITVRAPSTLATAANAADTALWGNSTCPKDVKGCPTP
jgi:ribose transport system substrate-binding protein